MFVWGLSVAPEYPWGCWVGKGCACRSGESAAHGAKASPFPEILEPPSCEIPAWEYSG